MLTYGFWNSLGQIPSRLACAIQSIGIRSSHQWNYCCRNYEDQINGQISKTVGWTTVVIMGMSVVIMFATWVHLRL